MHAHTTASTHMASKGAGQHRHSAAANPSLHQCSCQLLGPTLETHTIRSPQKDQRRLVETSRGCGLCLAMASAPHGLPLPWFLGLTAQPVPHTQALLQQTIKAAEACVPPCKFECCDWHCTDHNGPPFLCSVALHRRSGPQHSWDLEPVQLPQLVCRLQGCWHLIAQPGVSPVPWWPHK